MNREKLSDIIGGIKENQIAACFRYDPESAMTSSERIEHMKTKRLISFALVAAMILSLGIAAYAISGLVHSVGTHPMSGTGEYCDLGVLPEIETQVGFPIRLVERFSDGYVFTKLSVDGEAAFDEDMNALREYRIVNAVYTASDGTVRYITLSPVLDLPGVHEPPEPTERRTVGGMELRLSLDRYKLVPEDYEKTEADLAAEAAGHFYISYGAAPSQVGEELFASVGFTLDGAEYTILDMNGSAASLDGLARMAAELLAVSK